MFENLFGNNIEIRDGIVQSVDESKGVCAVNVAVEGEDPVVLPDVALRAAADGDASGLILIPAVGAYVVFAKISGEDDYTLVKTSKLDKVIVNCDHVLFNKGNLGGLPISGKVAEKLNQLETEINNLKTLLSAYAPTGIPTDGVLLKTTVSTWFNPMVLTTASTLENTKIKQ